MKRRRFKLRWPRGLKPSYKRNHALHAHEAAVILALVEERQCAWQARWRRRSLAAEWCHLEPERWDRRCLVLALERLSRDIRLIDAASRQGQMPRRMEAV